MHICILFIVYNPFLEHVQLLYFSLLVHFFSAFLCDLSMMMSPSADRFQKFDHQYYSGVTNEPGMMCSVLLGIQYYDK